MRRRAALGTIVILVILGGIISYFMMRPAPAKVPGTVEIPTLSGSAYSEHAAYYDIAANYATSTPLLENAGVAADAAATVLMRKFVASTIAQFKTDGNFANLTPEDIQTTGFSANRKETLQITYLIASSPQTVSYIFTTYEDTLGAHGNMFFHTFTFDAATGKELSLADLFTPGSAYLGTLSTLARAKLPAIIGQDASARMLDSGTTPDAQNFENFFLDNQQLVILFAPYAVAPYAAGPQTLRIPMGELSGILKPEYRR